MVRSWHGEAGECYFPLASNAKDMTDIYMALKRWSLAHGELLDVRGKKRLR
jgi:hypothetical protein